MALRIALAQLNPIVGDIPGNTQLVLSAWRAAANQGADLVVFPELVVTGYPPDDLLLKPEFVSSNVRAIGRLVDEGPSGTVAVVGYARPDDERHERDDWDVTVASRRDLRNSAAVIADGQVVAVYDKARLPNYGVFDEARYFTPRDNTVVINVAGVAVGVTICEDLWSRSGPVTAVAQAGARVVVNLNASPFHRGKRDDRERWIRQHATNEGVWLAYVNTVGGHDELVFDGDSVLYAPDGTAAARAAQFRTDLVTHDIDPQQGARPVEGAPELAGHRGERGPQPPGTTDTRLGDVAEVWEALVLGTRDYCRKNGFSRAVVGMSGGIDSSVTATVAVDALGADNVLGVMMPSPYTSESSLTDAKQVAENLGIRYEVLPIERAMEAFDVILEDLFADVEEDVTEENIQARIRGILLMAISNKFGHIVLASGNKSELAVGYATLYGDMAGGFAILKDCRKGLVYELARHRNQREQAIPDNVLTKPPSAELRPEQRDQDALPPYDVLDPILCAYVEEDCSIDEIVARGFDDKTVRQVIDMVDRAEYKRRQAPPGVKITERAFGRDRRVPITNGWGGEEAEAPPSSLRR